MKPFIKPKRGPGGSIKKTTEWFIQKAKTIHGDTYIYDKTVYTGAHNKLVITCRIHGDFEQACNNHLKGKGCRICGGSWTRTTEDFIKKAREVHGDRYNYDKVEYVNNARKVTITCQAHGDFLQTPHNHTAKKQNCPKCPESTRISNKETEWLASLNIKHLSKSHRIYSSTHNRKFVVDGYDKITNTIYLFHGDYWHGNLNRYERSTINKTTGKTMGELYDSTILYENQLQEIGYKVVTMWESDWIAINL